MNQVVMFERLKEYLTKEYIRLSEEKEVILGRKLSLEEKEKKTKDLFFNAKMIESRRRLFSPLENYLFEDAMKEREDAGENSIMIQKMEKDANDIEQTLFELKEYINFLQNMKREKEDHFGVTNNLKDMLLTVAAFLQSQYKEIEFLIDFEEEELITSVSFNENLIRILTYTISSTVETMKMDSVIIDVKKENTKINISIYMLLEDEVLDYHTYDFRFVNRGLE